MKVRPMNQQQPAEVRQRRYGKMSATLTLGVSMVIAIIFQGVVSNRSIAQRQVPAEVDKELRALLVARRDVLKDFVGAMQSEMDSSEAIGAGGIAQLARARYEFYKAELELTESKKERIEILERALEAQSEVEEMFEVRQEPRGLGYHAKAERIKIEIELHKEKKKP